MGESIREISVEALRLPARSRALLAELLLDSLDESSVGSFEQEWLGVARERDKDLEDGAVSPQEHDDVVGRARDSLE